MSMEYFCCYHSYKKKCEKLSDQELGRLFRALLEYSESGAVADLAGRESIAFDFIADDINRAKKAYAEKCAKNAANAQQRSPANANGRMRSPANANGRSQDKEEDKKEDEEEDKGINPPYSPPKGDGDSLFEQFWAVYPHKVGKGAARKAWKKIKPSKALCQKMINAVKLAKKSQEWAEDGGAYIPHPSTWLNQERWEDTLTPLGQRVMPRGQTVNGDDYSEVWTGQKAQNRENIDDIFASYPALKARYAGYCQECAQNGAEPISASEFLALQKSGRKAGGEYAEVY